MLALNKITMSFNTFVITASWIPRCARCLMGNFAKEHKIDNTKYPALVLSNGTKDIPHGTDKPIIKYTTDNVLTQE